MEELVKRLGMLLIALGVSSLGSPKPLVAQELFTMPEQKVETRWANAENPTGEKGKAAQTNAGRKGSAYAELKAGQSRVLAEATGTTAWRFLRRGTGTDRGVRVGAVLES
jgi:hypothetical protein